MRRNKRPRTTRDCHGRKGNQDHSLNKVITSGFRTDVSEFGIRDKKQFRSLKLNRKKIKKKIRETVGLLHSEIHIIVMVINQTN